MNHIAKNIRTIRTKLGMRQQQLANSLGVSRNVVMNWERGRSVPDYTALSYLSRLSGIAIGDITSQELDPASIPAQPPTDFISADYIDKRLGQIEALLTGIDNKLDKITGVKD
jgi:transcriptional regulator with XRE-family HTH domain